MPEHSLIGLFIFLALLIGWVIGRYSYRKHVNTLSNGLSLHNDYFRGLNFVINEQPDKAIEIFIKMLEVDTETVETHLALGNLFRRRGEVDRAIRIHQNLIARPTLNQEQRSLAMLELGQDYMSSGLFDRAESLLLELTEKGIHLKEAYHNLIQIYEQEKDWERAIAVSRQLEYYNGGKRGPVIAHYYCEQASFLLEHHQINEFHDRINRALGTDPHCVRASLMQAKQRLEEGKHRLALKALRRIEKQDPELLEMTIELFAQIYSEMHKEEEYIQQLQYLAKEHNVVSSIIKLADRYREQNGDVNSLSLITQQLSQSPSLLGVNRMLKIVLENDQIKRNSILNSIQQMTESLLEELPAYQCSRCGFEAKLVHWQCPSCKEWNTIKPLYRLTKK